MRWITYLRLQAITIHGIKKVLTLSGIYVYSMLCDSLWYFMIFVTIFEMYTHACHVIRSYDHLYIYTYHLHRLHVGAYPFGKYFKCYLHMWQPLANRIVPYEAWDNHELPPFKILRIGINDRQCRVKNFGLVILINLLKF